jgi:UDP-glucuronate 4-epimerase
MKQKVFITGAAGFIGSQLAHKLLEMGYSVYGLDFCQDGDLKLKAARLNTLKKYPHFTFLKVNIEKSDNLSRAYASVQPDYVIHLAAQSGVRFKEQLVDRYLQTNIVGFSNLLECFRQFKKPKLFLFASSSSIYGKNQKLPLRLNSKTDQPLSLYAATKKTNELLAHVYSHLFNIRTIGFRLFNVYGPWSRPDMMISKFTTQLLNSEPISLFNKGKHKRDLIFIDDVVECFVKALKSSPKKTSKEFFKIYNLGSQTATSSISIVRYLEKLTGTKAKLIYAKRNPEEMLETKAEVGELKKNLQFKARTPLIVGLKKFYSWHQIYYKRARKNL